MRRAAYWLIGIWLLCSITYIVALAFFGDLGKSVLNTILFSAFCGLLLTLIMVPPVLLQMFRTMREK